MAENSFAESVKPVAFSIIIRRYFHFLTPNPRECEVRGQLRRPCVCVIGAQLRARSEMPAGDISPVGVDVMLRSPYTAYKVHLLSVTYATDIINLFAKGAWKNNIECSIYAPVMY